MPGEDSWPTQPFPTAPPPFARQKIGVEDLNPYIEPEELAKMRDVLLHARAEGIFTPPTLTGNQIAIPGENGGANWGSVAADPGSGMVYVRTFDAPTIHRMTETPPQRNAAGGTPAQQGYALYTRYCIGCHGPDRARITFPKQIDASRFQLTLRNGKAEMPAFSEDTLPQASVDLLKAYLTDPSAGEAPVRGARQCPAVCDASSSASSAHGADALLRPVRQHLARQQRPVWHQPSVGGTGGLRPE